jgi:hypothetical protein
MLELLKFAKKYPVTDGGSRPIIDVRQATYFSPSSTAWSASSSQGYHSSTLVQARGPNRFQSVSTSTDRPLIHSKNGPATCSPGSNTSPQAKAGRKRNYSCNLPARSRFENPNGPSASLPGSAIPSAKAGRSTQFLGNSSDRPPIQSKNGPAAACSPGLIPLLRRKPEGSVITVATRLLDRVLKTQMLVLPHLCQVLPPPQRKLLDRVLSSSATSQIDLPFNPKMVLPLVCLVLIPLLRQKLEGSVITVAIRSLDRVSKTQMVLPHLCRVLPPPQR